MNENKSISQQSPNSKTLTVEDLKKVTGGNMTQSVKVEDNQCNKGEAGNNPQL